MIGFLGNTDNLKAIMHAAYIFLYECFFGGCQCGLQELIWRWLQFVDDNKKEIALWAFTRLVRMSLHFCNLFIGWWMIYMMAVFICTDSLGSEITCCPKFFKSTLALVSSRRFRSLELIKITAILFKMYVLVGKWYSVWRLKWSVVATGNEGCGGDTKCTYL